MHRSKRRRVRLFCIFLQGGMSRSFEGHREGMYQVDGWLDDINCAGTYLRMYSRFFT